MLDECHVDFRDCSHELVWVTINIQNYIKVSVNNGFAERKKYEMLSYVIHI